MLTNKLLLLLVAILLFSFELSLVGQIGGNSAFEFASIPASARTTALGGSLITVRDGDLNLADHNPALLDSLSHNQLSFSNQFNFAGINSGYVAYARKLKWWDMSAHISMKYISYGDFVLSDAIGNNIGSFSGTENYINLGISKQLNERIRVGANIKNYFGSLESYNATGFGVDLGMTYSANDSSWVYGLVFQNVGIQSSAYFGESRKLPLDIQIGISKKLNHLPFRLSIIAHNLQQWNVRYDDPNKQEITNLFGETNEVNKLNQTIDNFFRHFIFSGTFLIGKNGNYKIRFSYNHLRKKELSLSEFQSFGGFGFGFGLKLYKFYIDYGVGVFHLAGSTNHLTIRTNLNNFTSRI